MSGSRWSNRWAAISAIVGLIALGAAIGAWFWPQSSGDPAPPQTTTSTSVASSPSVAPDPGCTEALHAVLSFNAIAQGAAADPGSLATAYRGFASNLDQAAADATNPQVKTAINVVASDTRAIADALDASDFSTAKDTQYRADDYKLKTTCQWPDVLPT